MKKILGSTNATLAETLELSQLEERLEMLLVTVPLIDIFGLKGECTDRCDDVGGGGCDDKCDDTCDDKGGGGGCDWDCDDVKP